MVEAEEIELKNLVKEKRKPKGIPEMKEWLAKARQHVGMEERRESKIPDEAEATVNEVLTPELFGQLLEINPETKKVLLGEEIQDLGVNQKKIVQEQLRQLKPLAEFITGVKTEQLRRELESGMTPGQIAEDIMSRDEYADERAVAAMSMLKTMQGMPSEGEVPVMKPEEFAEEYRDNIKKNSFMKGLPKKLAKGFISNVIASLIFAV